MLLLLIGIRACRVRIKLHVHHLESIVGFLEIRYLVIALLFMLISGCAPRIVSSTPIGVAIEPVMAFPNMQRIREMAATECAKYGRDARERVPHAPTKIGYAWSYENGAQYSGNIYRSPRIGFSCVNRSEEAAPSYEWPILQ